MTRAKHPHGFRLRVKALCALTVLLAAAPSCDIKEDRGPCPCLLTLIYKEVPEVVRDVFRARIYRGESLQKDEEVNPSAEPEGHSVYVSKGENTVCYFGGVRKGRLESDRLMIPEGEESDPVFLGSETVTCNGDRASVLLDFRKDYCLLTLKLELLKDGTYPYDLEISGNVAGVDIRYLIPVEGNFRFVPDVKSKNVRSARIPRQKDSSLTLTLTDRKDGRSHSVPLGRLIVESGYDWNKRNLDDITVRMDLTGGDVSIDIAGWESGSVSDISL